MALSSIQWGMIAGGFGLFMFGITSMGDGLKSAAGDKLRDYIDKYTSTTASAVMIGIIVTILMQSSSASIAITIGLVRAGLMNLTQAAGIVIGANIGTTATSFLISLNIEEYALYFVFIGAVLICFIKDRKINYWGYVILGFGLIFYGLNCMGDALAQLKELPAFTKFALSMAENPMLALAAGIILTAILQSSAATIGVIQKLYQAGAVSFPAALPFVFGANIGTTMTGVLASIGGSLAARRTAGLHTLFNVIGGIIGMLILVPYTSFCEFLRNAMNLNPMMEIAVANIIFKVCTTVIFVPVLGYFTKLITKIIPGEEAHPIDVNTEELDENLISVLPSAAVTRAQQTMMKMVDVVRHNIVRTQKFMNTRDQVNYGKDAIEKGEEAIDQFDHKITEYLVKISRNTKDLSTKDIVDVRTGMDTSKNLERLGDLAMNLYEFFDMIFENKESFSDEAVDEINHMYDVMVDMLDDTAEIYMHYTEDLYKKIDEKERLVDRLEYEARNKHFERMAREVCTSAVASSVYCDILGNLERMSDHCMNIAKISKEAAESN